MATTGLLRKERRKALGSVLGGRKCGNLLVKPRSLDRALGKGHI